MLGASDPEHSLALFYEYNSAYLTNVGTYGFWA